MPGMQRLNQGQGKGKDSKSAQSTNTLSRCIQGDEKSRAKAVNGATKMKNTD